MPYGPLFMQDNKLITMVDEWGGQIREGIICGADTGIILTALGSETVSIHVFFRYTTR